MGAVQPPRGTCEPVLRLHSCHSAILVRHGAYWYKVLMMSLAAAIPRSLHKGMWRGSAGQPLSHCGRGVLCMYKVSCVPALTALLAMSTSVCKVLAWPGSSDQWGDGGIC